MDMMANARVNTAVLTYAVLFMDWQDDRAFVTVCLLHLLSHCEDDALILDLGKTEVS